MGATVAMVQVMVQAMVAMVATVATVVTVVAMVASMVATLATMAMVTTVSNLPVPVSTGTGKKFPFNSQSQASLGLTRLYSLTMKSSGGSGYGDYRVAIVATWLRSVLWLQWLWWVPG